MKIKWKCLVGSILIAFIGVPLASGVAIAFLYLIGWLLFDTGDAPTTALFGFYAVVVFVIFSGITISIYEGCIKRTK